MSCSEKKKRRRRNPIAERLTKQSHQQYYTFMFESKHECMISSNIMCKNRTMTNGIDCKLKENFTFRTPTTKIVTKYNYSHQIHCRRAHPFKGFIQNDCPSYRNSNLVRSEVFKYVIYVSNIWSQNITTVKHCDMSRKHDKYRLRKQTHVTIYKELQMQKMQLYICSKQS